MKPKQKAVELIESFRVYRKDNGIEVPRMGYMAAQECALISVNEILKMDAIWDDTTDGRQGTGSEEYWKKVKKELEI